MKPARLIPTHKLKDEVAAIEAADYVGVSVNAVYHRRDHKSKKLKHRWVHGICVFSIASLDDWKKERKADVLKKLAAIK